MNELMAFKSDVFGDIRVVEIGGKTWFVAGDIARALGYDTTAHAIRILDDDEKGVHKLVTLGGPQDSVIVNESGLYHLVFLSRLPNAKAFRRWVTEEVLPAIRRTGSFSTGALKKPDISLLYPDHPHDGGVPLSIILECVAIPTDGNVASIDCTDVPRRRSPYGQLLAEGGKRRTLIPRRHRHLSWDVASIGRLFEERTKAYLLSAAEVDPGWMLPVEMAWAAAQRPEVRYELMERRLVECLPSATRDELRRIVLMHDAILQLDGPTG